MNLAGSLDIYSCCSLCIKEASLSLQKTELFIKRSRAIFLEIQASYALVIVVVVATEKALLGSVNKVLPLPLLVFSPNAKFLGNTFH